MSKKTKQSKALKTNKKLTSKQPASLISYHRVLFIQSMFLAVIGGVAVYTIIKAGQLREEVDNQYIQVLGANTEVRPPVVQK